MARLHHVNLSVPAGGAEAEGEFLTGILGYSRLPSPEDIPQAR